MALFNYFTKLGTVNYKNELVNNLLVSVRFKEIVKQRAAIFYPYTIRSGERPDTIAFHYYEDERYAWIVYLSNYINDPFFEWPLDTNQFQDFIDKKYGSRENAINNIQFYRNAWYNDDTILSVSAYDSLPGYLKKYWNPNVGANEKIHSYTRKQVDWATDTNKIINIVLNNVTGIIAGERVYQNTSGERSAEGKVDYIGENYITVKNITGEFLATGGSVGSIIGITSNVSKTASSVTTISTPIPANEFVYWEKVSSFDYESELNESRKNIRLLDRQYLTEVEDQMEELLS